LKAVLKIVAEMGLHAFERIAQQHRTADMVYVAQARGREVSMYDAQAGIAREQAPDTAGQIRRFGVLDIKGGFISGNSMQAVENGTAACFWDMKEKKNFRTRVQLLPTAMQIGYVPDMHKPLTSITA
jgi:hypothetical protein